LPSLVLSLGLKMSVVGCDLLEIAGLTVITFGVCILSPFMMYALYHFHALRHAKIMKFRNSTLITAMNCCVILALLERGHFCFFVIWELENPVPRWTECIFEGVSLASIYLLVALKTWLLYFEQSYHFSVANAAWKKLINERAQSWFIRHRQTYGDWRYVLRNGALPSICYMALCIAMEIVVKNRSGASLPENRAGAVVLVMANCLLQELPLLFSVVVYYRFHSKDFKDLYHISREIKYQCALVAVYMILECAEALFHIIRYVTIGHLESQRADIVRLEALTNFVLTSLFLFGLSLLTSLYPVCIHLVTARRHSGLEHVKSPKMNRGKNLQSSISDIAHIISHKEGFKALMNHLLREFSTENLLFITELVQIKYAFQLKNHSVVIVPKFSVSTHSVDSETDDYFDTEKYTVIDFHATERRRSSIRSATPFSLLSRTVTPTLREGDVTAEQSEPKSSVGNESPVSTSCILSGINRKLSSCGRRGSESASHEITRAGKLPRMHTFLFGNDGSIRIKLVLPQGLPPSTALQDVHKKDDLALQFEYIFQKFIEPGALHEVNLSHGVRSTLCSIFDTERTHLTHGKVESFIFNVFDEAALQILELMCDSFSRFAFTRDFRYIQREIERDDSFTAEYREESGPSMRNVISLEQVMEQYGMESLGGLCFTDNVSSQMYPVSSAI